MSDLEVDLEQDTDSSTQFAYEVSEAWIAAEEAIAADITQKENCILLGQHTDSTGESDAEKLPSHRNAEQSYSRKRMLRSTPEGESTTKVDQLLHASQHKSPKLRRTDNSRERPSERGRTNYMGCLDDAHLMVLDAILRESEEASKIEAIYEQNQGIGSTREVALNMEDEHQFQSSKATTAILDVDQSSAMIHPMSAIASAPSIPRSNNSPVEVQATRLTRALSPVSWRRLQKRLYMRKRRAKLQGKSDTSQAHNAHNMDGGSTLDIRRLKPGRKPKTHIQEIPSRSSSPAMPDNADGQKLKQRKACQGGLTLLYKLRAKFREEGIDGAYLRGQEMDLFHLSALARLRDLYGAIEDGFTENDTAGEQDQAEGSLPCAIDARLIQHLQVAVVLFVTIVIHHIIVWKETQLRLKQQSLVWKEGDLIGRSAIEHGLQMLGVRYKSHKEYFAALHSDCINKVTAEITPGFAESRGMEGSMTREGGVSAATQAPPSDLYTPLAPALGLHPLEYICSTYIQEAMRREDRVVEKNEASDEDLMPNETDEDALEEELRLDQELDKKDMESAEEYEENLWEAIAGDGPCD